jgi:hypothetical protein
MITLQQILELVGTLDDSAGANTARERFRKYLDDSVGKIGAVRDYVETCLRTVGPQYNRALQDLVNHVASLIQFEVEFGRYSGVINEIGYDGIWRSKDLDIVVEVKTTDAYAIKTATLLGYIDQLISEKRLQSWDRTIGLYLVGRPDAELKQLENAILAEKRTHQLRVATIHNVLALGELVENKRISHDEAVLLLRPVGVSADNIIGLVDRVAGDLQEVEHEVESSKENGQKISRQKDEVKTENVARAYLMTPVADTEKRTAEQTIRTLLDSGWYVFGERTPGRKPLKTGDLICFFSSGIGVVAHAEVASAPEKKTIAGVQDPDRFPWAFKVKDVHYYLDKPVVIDAALRANLDAFKKANAEAPWGWFVASTKILSEHDFTLLTNKQ